MDSPPLINVLIIVAIVGVLFFVLILPAIRRQMARSGGVLVEARVKSIEDTAKYDEHHRQYRRLRLEVMFPGKPPYEVAVEQVLPWLSGPGTSLKILQVRAHPRYPKAVVVIGPPPPPGVAVG